MAQAILAQASLTETDSERGDSVMSALHTMPVEELANTAWAFATVKQSDEKLFTELAKEAERRMSEFNAQAMARAAGPRVLANTAWAFATLRRPDGELFTTLARAAEPRARAEPRQRQNLAYMAWAFAKNEADR